MKMGINKFIFLIQKKIIFVLKFQYTQYNNVTLNTYTFLLISIKIKENNKFRKKLKYKLNSKKFDS